MQHPDRAIHLGLRYGFLQPKDLEKAEQSLKDLQDFNQLKSWLINHKCISEDRMIMLDSVVTEEKNYDRGDVMGEKYEIIRPIGAGAMAKVILAKNIETNQLVALKLVPVGEKENKNLVARFKQEVRLHASLQHKNIAQVYDNFVHDGRQVLAVEYIEGQSLASLLEQGPLPIRQALEITYQVARALNFLHHRDLVHRDIKPGNILVSKEGQVKLLDLGLAKNLKDPMDFTQTGAIVGTPQYMAPEQAQGSDLVDFSSDIYSLGVTLFHMITGRIPFGGKTRKEVIRSRLKKDVPDSRKYRKGIPEGVRQILKKMTARDPANRYREAEVLCRDLQKALDEPLKIKEGLLLLSNNTTFLALALLIMGGALGAVFYLYGLDWFQSLHLK